MKKSDYQNLGIAALVIIIIGALWFMFTAGNSATPAATGAKMDITFATDPNPAHVGTNNFVIQVRDGNGKPVENAEVSYSLNMTTMNMGTQTGTATTKGNGQYSGTGMFSMGGPWRVSTTVKTPTGDVMTKDTVLNVQ